MVGWLKQKKETEMVERLKQTAKLDIGTLRASTELYWTRMLSNESLVKCILWTIQPLFSPMKTLLQCTSCWRIEVSVHAYSKMVELCEEKYCFLYIARTY